jgi:nucleoside 2-deoxyribosyltransferase
MENRGETQDQIQDIINKIKQCSIFIADISNNNPNVMYEAGWARALDKHVILFREKKSEKPKSDYANDTYHEYDNDARSVTLHKIAMENIVEVLNKNFGLIYE